MERDGILARAHIPHARHVWRGDGERAVVRENRRAVERRDGDNARQHRRAGQSHRPLVVQRSAGAHELGQRTGGEIQGDGRTDDDDVRRQHLDRARQEVRGLYTRDANESDRQAIRQADHGVGARRDRVGLNVGPAIAEGRQVDLVALGVREIGDGHRPAGDAERESVGACAARQGIGAPAASDEIRARAAGDGVVAGPAIDDGRAGPGVDGLPVVAEVDRVGAAAEGEAVRQRAAAAVVDVVARDAQGDGAVDGPFVDDVAARAVVQDDVAVEDPSRAIGQVEVQDRAGKRPCADGDATAIGGGGVDRAGVDDRLDAAI